jgi:hypothetical protein
VTDQAQKQYPALTGLIWHRNRYYSFFIASDWHKLRWSDNRKGVIYGPDPTDPLTILAVDVKALGTPITAADLDVLADGFFESLEQLPGVEITFRNQQVTGALLELEAKYTFQDQGQTRKRWTRVFYHETRQIAMTAQGATPEKYDYWLPIFFEAMATVRLHNSKPRGVPSD